MKTALWVFAFSALGLLPVKSSEREIPYFVSTQWLADLANDSGLVILQKAFTRKEYEVAHIPGTRFLWFRRLAIDTPDLSTEMPDIRRQRIFWKNWEFHETLKSSSFSQKAA